jgi:hypothetical protein
MDISQERDLAELTTRLDYLLTTKEISDTDKIATLNDVLSFLEQKGGKGSVPSWS